MLIQIRVLSPDGIPNESFPPINIHDIPPEFPPSAHYHFAQRISSFYSHLLANTPLSQQPPSGEAME